MAEVKTVTIFGPGRTTSREGVEIIPGESVEQVLSLVIPELGLPPGRQYQLIGPDGVTITGDVFKAVKDGDKLSIGRIDEGA